MNTYDPKNETRVAIAAAAAIAVLAAVLISVLLR